ncbi:MAG: Glu-tRNA(Gln) amidotransferase subunit GatE [Candidatus Bathyarchaeota archaeon]|nr:Glu-tRNA(Gln) amidotransferase subunit GatE [Candidatus Bathyarchaeum tardum]WGM88705.1 MAG: Glu-tRNA(Gln) amidotransferase subunit GatE [Candidatus Bathyarchaeum tardum]WNZ29039.1 MAG: Glu-tRNA(Gln) amidotransferase subunit GatE [Candidatus Bathyarchaeota archaeon]
MSNKYAKIGFKAGLEIHQQLDTKEKLFCSCQPELFKEDPQFTFLRKLRPAQSELGKVDDAALFEFQKEKQILYEANNHTACLVEMDEEPPHDLNSEAVEITLLTSLMMNMRPVDEVHVMRKTVIDGSNTTGFQRTCVVALNGAIDVKGKSVEISQVSLEEDAARKMGTEGQLIRYRIDRLGIPLIEITTAPVIYTPLEAQETAAAIGRILRSTRRVKRGLGTIRQDVNVSIRDGALIEIKGVQELDLVSQVIENEVQRQLSLLELRDELNNRGVTESDLDDAFVDVTHVFKNTNCKVISRAIKNKNPVLAVKLPCFGGLLKKELAPGMRLGSELAGMARFWGKVGGIFHTDEMPAYGVTQEEIDELGHVLNKQHQDALVFVADTQQNSVDALKAVVERAKVALQFVPEETRSANPDGTTKYMRPRPGAARMYPETDVSPIQITNEYVEDLKGRLPELPEDLMKRLMTDYKINRKLAKQVLDSDYLELFECLSKETKVSTTVIAVALTETLKALQRDGVNIDAVSETQFKELCKLIGQGKTAKESIPEVLTWLAKNEGADVNEALENLGLSMMSQKELEALVDDVIEKNSEFIEHKGAGAAGALMGIVMKKARGRVKPKEVNEILKDKLNQ